MTKPKQKPREKPEVVVVTTRLLTSDVAELQRRAGQSGVPWHTQLRALVHEALFPTRTKVL